MAKAQQTGGTGKAATTGGTIVEKPPAEAWTKDVLAAEAKADPVEWQAILDKRRETLRPECIMSGAEAVDLLKTLEVDVFQSAAGECRVYFLPKSGGRLRMLCTTDDWTDTKDQERLVAELIVRAVVARMANLDLTLVYWYIDDILGKTGDGRVFLLAAQIIDQDHSKLLQVESRGDLTAIIWEVRRRQ
jgi:hypothetical protein